MVKLIIFAVKVYGDSSTVSLLGSIAFLLLVELRILSLFGRNLPRVVSVAFNREASELDPGGLCKAWWVSGMA